MADKNLIEDESINLKDVSNINEEDPVAAPIVQLLLQKYNKAETTRRNDEEVLYVVARLDFPVGENAFGNFVNMGGHANGDEVFENCCL